MDYERIQKSSTQGGGISPSKLRLVLLGSDKRRKDAARRVGDDDDEEIQSRSALRSQDAAAEIEGRRSSVSDTCKDLDVIISYPDCASTLRQKHPSRSHPADDDGLDTDSVSSISSGFEFQRSDRASSQRQQASTVMAPFSKPAPSKWDDAQKWIASPTSTRQGKAAQNKRGSLFGYGSRSGNAASMAATTKLVVEVGDEPDTKRMMDQSQQQTGRKSVEWAQVDPYSAEDHYSDSKPDGGGGVFVNTSVADHAAAINLSQHDPSLSAQPSIGFVAPPSTVRSVSMRDMGTEMTPIASEDPSRTGTPARASTPIRSPSTSRPSSPGKTPPQNAAAQLTADGRWIGDAAGHDVSDKELKQIREEIMVLGTKLGKPNIAAWASRDDDDDDGGDERQRDDELVGADGVKTPEITAIEMRAAAWEEAEKAKYLTRFKREEIKIQAWENHQKAKAEAEMRKTEVEVERMRAEAHERLMNRLASARHKAEEKRASAEARRSHHAAKTAQQAEYIRRTGKLPSSFTRCSCWNWSFCR